jgi:hypothetical protein
MLTWFTAWRERRRRMQWFTNEFLPKLEAVAGQTGQGSVAAEVVAVCHPTPQNAEAAIAGGDSPLVDPQGLHRLGEVLRALPESERERLKALVRSQSRS